MKEQLTKMPIAPVSADSYERQSELNDMKQHADKIIQGIKKLDDNDANRAIWELFQNAVDQSTRCEVTIKLTEEMLEFGHNGQPFTTMTLDCLFKQVSSKTLEEKRMSHQEGDPVGQYGTGFITTHSFGNVVSIDGALLNGEGYIPIKNFKIDRNTDNWKELGRRISDLKKEVSRLLRTEKIMTVPFPPTVFRYKTTSKHEQDCAEKAIGSLPAILPFVMVLNEKLEKVTVTGKNGTKTIYQKKPVRKEGNIYVSEVLLNKALRKIYHIGSTKDKITVILPFADHNVATDLPDNLPRLFLYYPLIGTHDLGMNYLIHSKHFQPTEPRNGLYFNSENENTRTEEETNRTLLAEASQIIFDHMKEFASSIANPIKLARIDFPVTSGKLSLDDYFQGLKDTWISEFKEFPIVETGSGNIKPSEAIFWDDELLLNKEVFDPIFNLINQFWDWTPKKELIHEWTRIIDAWNLKDIEYFKLDDLALVIKEEGKLSAFQLPKDLQSLYGYLLREGHAHLFTKYELLPNLKGEFRLLSGLNKNVNLPPVLIEIAEIMMPEIPKRHIHPDFQFDLELDPYKRKDYEAAINQVVNLIKDDATSADIPEASLNKWIDYCKITTVKDTTSVPSKMIKQICRYFGVKEDIIVIPAIKDDELDIRAPQRKLVRVFLNDIATNDESWIIKHLGFLKQVIDTGAFYDTYKELFATLPIFPNQLNELMVQGRLQIDDNIPEEIKDLYDKVIDPDLPIRATLVHDMFKATLTNKEKRTVRSLTDRIESEFSENGQYNDINDHPYKKEILDIIKRLSSEPEWERYFPALSNKRANVMLDTVTDAHIKNDVFSIVTLDHKQINLLGDLARNKDLEHIVRLGKEAFISEQQEHANFQHKYALGTHIEKMLRENLGAIIPGDIKAKVENVQDGQDIIITIDEVELFFLEVKSRWDPNNSVRMSKNQTIKAYGERANYALCSIDMTKYKGKDKYKVENIELIKDLIWFNTDIGEKVAHLIDVLNQTMETNTVRLDGEFRTIVPMWYIEEGMGLEAFGLFLINYLKDKVDPANRQA